jgi:hypothetical protein
VFVATLAAFEEVFEVVVEDEDEEEEEWIEVVGN